MIVRFIVVLFAVCFAGAARAQWTMPGSACTPNNATINFSRHLVGNGTVQHTPNNIDKIVLYCAVAPFDTVNFEWNLHVNYQDSTGTGPGARVLAQLFSMPNFSDGAPTPLAAANSNSSATTTLTFMEVTFNHTFNFTNNTYWVRVELDRSSTNQTVILRSVGLLFET